MSRENVELVRKVYEAAARGDTEAVLALYGHDVEYDFSRSPFGSAGVSKSVYRGHDGLRAFFRERYETWERVEDLCQELIEVNDQVISVVTTRGRGRQSGAEVGGTHFGVWTIRAGKVIRATWFGTREEAIAAAGLSE